MKYTSSSSSLSSDLLTLNFVFSPFTFNSQSYLIVDNIKDFTTKTIPNTRNSIPISRVSIYLTN